MFHGGIRHRRWAVRGGAAAVAGATLAGSVLLTAGAAGAAGAATATGCGAAQGTDRTAGTGLPGRATSVTGPDTLQLPAGGTAPFTVRVRNTGSPITGGLSFLLTGTDAGTVQAGLQIARPDGSWRTLPPEGAAGSVGFTVEPLAVGTGTVAVRFRLTAPASALPNRLRVSIAGYRTGGGSLGRAEATAWVTNSRVPAPKLTENFPHTLRRGGPFSQFTVTARNDSVATYRDNSALLSLFSSIVVGDRVVNLEPRHVRLERLTASGWRQVLLETDCDPTINGHLGEPFWLEPGQQQTLTLRIRLTPDAPTALTGAQFWVQLSNRELRNPVEQSGEVTFR